MAKGKGKGQNAIDSCKDGVSCCCCCVFCLIFLPPILLIISLCLLFGHNTRVERIEKYNQLVVDWNNKGRDTFMNNSITVGIGKDNVKLTKIDSASGSYWPVRDSCKQDDDPAEGCIKTKPYNLRGENWYSSYSNVTLYNNGTKFFSSTIDYNKYNIYTARQLSCDDGKVSCYDKCKDKSGVWDGYRCTVTLYLYNICYRVIDTKNGYRIDTPATLPLHGVQGMGCEYHDGGWDPATYVLNSRSTVIVTIRYYEDPYIIASDLTSGCSSDSSISTSCFGATKKEQQGTGIILLVIAIIGLCIEIATITLMVFCCKSSFKAIFHKKDSLIPNKNYGQYSTAPQVVAPPVYQQQPYYNAYNTQPQYPTATLV
ncbi:hypothetical protein WA158_003655 [Blastocystis sp. Blastoise]